MAVSGSAGGLHGHSHERRLARPARRVISAKRRRLQMSSSRARPEPATRAPALNDVGFWPRVAAFVIDCLIVGGVTDIILAALPVTAAATTEGATGPGMVAEGPTLMRALAFALYFVLMNGAYGSTLGKMMHGYRVVNEDGSRIGHGAALFRYFLAVALSCFTLGLFFLSVATDPKHRGWHDRLLGTRVIYNR